MKNYILTNAAILAAILLISSVFTSCDKNDYITRKVRIASYESGVTGGDGWPHRVLCANVNGSWDKWPSIAGFNFEQGYEYEIEVELTPKKSIEGVQDLNFTYDLSLVKLISKVKKETADCPYGNYFDVAKQSLSYNYERSGVVKIASRSGNIAAQNGVKTYYVQYDNLWQVWHENWFMDFAYEEGYEYMVNVESKIVDFDGETPVCEVKCLNVISKEQKQTEDCPF